MPNLKERTPVEGWKLTNEQKAFHKTFQKVNAIQKIIEKGVLAQQSKLQAMTGMLKELMGKKKELLLQAPDQPTFEAADEGMVNTKPGMGRKPTEPRQMMEGTQ